MGSSSSILAVTVVLGATLIARDVRATEADDLCAPTDDPCVVSESIVMDPDSFIDVGERTIQIPSGVTVKWSRTLEFLAASCDFLPGSKLQEILPTDVHGRLALQCGHSTLAGKISTKNADINVQGDGPHAISGAVQVKSGNYVNAFIVETLSTLAAGTTSIDLTGKIQVKGHPNQSVGTVAFLALTGDVVVREEAAITVKGKGPALHFELSTQSGSLTMDGAVAILDKGFESDLAFLATEDVSFGPTSLVKVPSKALGPRIDIRSAMGTATIQGAILARVSQNVSNFPSQVFVCAGGDILIRDGAVINTFGAGIDPMSGDPGTIIAGAGGKTWVGDPGGAGAELVTGAGTNAAIELCGGPGIGATIHAPSTVEGPTVVLGETGPSCATICVPDP